jgi:hypothetical protein
MKVSCFGWRSTVAPRSSFTVTSASVGTALTTGSGTITAISMSQPVSASETVTPLTLIDQAAPPASAAAAALPARTLYSASADRANRWRQAGHAADARSDGTGMAALAGVMNIAYAKGIYMQSAPVGLTFTITA